jgi:citrate lyase gamma subunit
MVTATSVTTDLPGIEHIAIAGTDDNGNIFTSLLMRENLDASDQTIYDNAIALFGDNYNLTIDNTLSELSIDRMTSTVIDLGTSEVVDYSALSEADKDKLRDFLTLAITNKDA